MPFPDSGATLRTEGADHLRAVRGRRHSQGPRPRRLPFSAAAKPAARSRAPYTPCQLYYDGWQPIAVGHFLKTPAGSAYLIQTIRQNRNLAYRRHLGCVRWPGADIPVDATVHPLYWYPRKRRTSTLQQLQHRAAA